MIWISFLLLNVNRECTYNVTLNIKQLSRLFLLTFLARW
jgi:hypothetical protein